MKRICLFFMFSIMSYVAQAATPTVAVYGGMASYAKDCNTSGGNAYSFAENGTNKQYIDSAHYSQLHANKMQWIKEEHIRRGIQYPANLNRDLIVQAAAFIDAAKASGQLVCEKRK